ncbi:ELL-associated factor protein [Rutstroemia sp. NJR-2017a BBW]|nr:ELL-associated factor protein [Rutstroemia sp. NJR-2017a BBW]
MAAAAIDFEKPGKYPIVLSDALLGKSTNSTYTGVRYNHKPDSSSDDSTTSAQLKPSADSNSNKFNLSLSENNEEYSYTGVRTAGDGQYVLIFDPVKKHFVLDRIDSTFDMNLTSAPWTSDASKLQSQYTQLELPTQPAKEEPQPQPKAPPRKQSKAKAATTTKAKAPPRAKAEKAKKAKPAPREPTPEPEEDSDDGLTVEYPDGPASQQHYEYRPPAIFQREPSEEISDEDEDAEHEIYEERNQDVDHLKLPSPVNKPGGLSDEDIELDLEAELEQALAAEHASSGADESSESEEE